MVMVVVGLWGMGVEASVDFVVVVGESWFALGRVRRRGGGRRVFRRTGLRAGFGSVPQSHSGQDAEDVHVEVHGPGKDTKQADNQASVGGLGPRKHRGAEQVDLIGPRDFKHAPVVN